MGTRAVIAGPPDQLCKRGAALSRRNESFGARPELPTLEEEVRLSELAEGRHLKLKLVRRMSEESRQVISARDRLLGLPKPREKRKTSSRFGVYSENLGYVYFLYSNCYPRCRTVCSVSF